jgi:hypothetical protein
MSPFDYLKHILEAGGDPDLLSLEENKKDYQKNIFVINRGLAQTIDTVMFAQELNKYAIVDPDQHYQFCFYSIKKRKRWAKWAKKSDLVTGLDEVCLYYKVNKEQAAEYMKILTKCQLQEIISSFEPAYEKKGSKK